MSTATRFTASLSRLRAGKRALRKKRVAMSLPEKVRQVVELQKAVLPTIARRRPLLPWEKVWQLDESSDSRRS